MYKILVVDDEPRVIAGIKNYLLHSELDIMYVETALNGFEALDYLRMDTFDLMLTDIQMSMMNGIELMEAILIEQPYLPVIVISAHEKFEFAKKSLQLGARDYLIKPVELDELIRVVGKVLGEKKEAGKQTLEHTEWRTDKEESLFGRRNEALMELVTEKGLEMKDYNDLASEIGHIFEGREGKYGIATVHLDLSKGGFSQREITLKDRKLLKYASINIVEESLSEWRGAAFYGFGNQLISVIQLNEQEVSDSRIHMNPQLYLIGQMIYMNLKQYLNVDATVGLSTLSSNISMLPKLLEEAEAAIEWSKLHPTIKVFYYEDMIGQDNINMLEWVTKVEEFVQQLKTTSANEEALSTELHSIVKLLTNLGSSEELFNSCFGLLVYRLYGLLFDYGHDSSESLHRFDPDFYFRGMDKVRKIGILQDYIHGLFLLLRKRMSDRDQTIISRVMGYIHKHFNNHGLRIQDIAGEVHFSPAYVSYLFKKEMEKNLWDYVTEVRIEEAKRLLTTTDMKRYEIAYQVGYESPEHFSRMFKRYLGVSPAEYRKVGQGEFN